MFIMKKIQILLIGLMFAMPCCVFAQNYIYGDVNGDGEVSISDVNAVISVILGDGYSKSIVGSWVSEYALDDNGERFDIPASIVVSFDFYENHTGLWGNYIKINNDLVADYVDLTWEQNANRLFLWFDDGYHEELYYKIDDNGYLLLSLNAQLSQYTAYRPVAQDHPLGTGINPHCNDNAVTIKAVSRALNRGHQTVE